MGTPAFMPPEQARSRWQEVDAKSDLYAIGATMFYLLTGQGIRQGETRSEQLALAIHTPAPRLRSILPDVNADLARLVDQTLAYDRNDRYQSAAHMQLEVRRVMAIVPAPTTTSVAPAPASGEGKAITSDRWSSGPQSLTVAPAITISIQRKAAVVLLCTLLFSALLVVPACSTVVGADFDGLVPIGVAGDAGSPARRQSAETRARWAAPERLA